MACDKGNLTSGAAPPGGTGERSAEPYLPPMVEWEEEFAPVADSLCAPPDLCPDGFRVPGES
jgi:hypothetical protein